MAGLIYVLDTNAISELMKADSPVYQRMRSAIGDGDTLCLCQPVYYELMRGLLRAGATRKLDILQNRLMPHFRWTELADEDWAQAARYWVDATRKGRQFSDVDLLIAAVAARLDAVVVSSDDDFDALPVRREDWRRPLENTAT